MNDHTTDHSGDNPREPRRRGAILWAGGVIAAAVLVLSVNGTLSAWTTAIIDNTDNSVAVKGAVVLVETDGTHTCDTGVSTDNTASCTTINKYGGIGTPLDPDSGSGGNVQSVTVNLKNNGTVPGDLVLSTDPCASTAAAGSTNADPVGSPVCDKVTVDVACTAPGSDPIASPALLSAFAGGDVGVLAPTESTDCTFTLTLPVGTPSTYASQVASQALHWTLTAS